VEVHQAAADSNDLGFEPGTRIIRRSGMESQRDW